MMRRRTSLVALVAAVLLAAGCSQQAAPAPTGAASSQTTTAAAPSSSSASSSSPSTPGAADLVDEMQAAVAKAKSVRIKGKAKDADATYKIDLQGPTDGSALLASLAKTGEPAFEMLAVGKTVYLRGDTKFWQSMSIPTNPGKGKWVHMPGVTVKDFGDFTIEDTLKTSVQDEQVLAALRAGTVTEKTVDGGEVIAIEAGSTTVLLDPKTKLPLRLYDESGDVSFSKWNAVKKPTKPAAKDVVELAD